MKCELCGKEFKCIGSHIKKIHRIECKSYYDRYLKKENEEKCIVCGKESGFLSIKDGYFKHCSYRCMQKNPDVIRKRKQTNLIKHGYENPFESKEIQKQIRQTNLEKYGSENPTQNEDVKKKRIQTCIKNQGVENPSQSAEVKEKKKKKSQEKFGTDYVFQSDVVKDKTKITLMENYGVDNIFKDVEYIKECNTKKHGVDHWTKTIHGKEVLRTKRIESLESRFPNGQKMDPREGKNEQKILDEIEQKCNIKITRKQILGGLYPDGIEYDLKCIIEIDEPHHLDKLYKNHDKDKDDYYHFKNFTVIRILEQDWFRDKQEVIDRVLYIVEFLKQMKSLHNKE